MTYLLDTNVVIAMLRGHSGLRERLQLHEPTEFALPAVVAHELFYGARRGARAVENLARVQALPFAILAFDAGDADASAEIGALLSSSGREIGPYDLLIAGQAIARDLILITRNTREFSRVRGLRHEDWEGSRTS